MDNVEIENFSKLAVMIFNKECGNSFNCGIPFNSFASQSRFLELNDNEIREILDYCIKENIFKEIDETFWLTILGQIKIQEILEEIGNIKKIYYVEDQNISLSDRLLLFLNEQSPMDVGLLRVNFHIFAETDIMSALNDLLSTKLINNDNNQFTTPFDDYKSIYKIFGFENVSITVEGKRKAYKLLKNPEISGLYKLPTLGETNMLTEPPIVIKESLKRFKNDYPDPNKVAFIMMKFGETKAHREIVKAIKTVLDSQGITGVRADDKHYHDDLFPNVVTYMYGCGFGISVFERIEEDEFNPNVSLEVGYMFALNKAVCLLKDRTLKTLHTDLVGKLYKSFDPQDPNKNIPDELTQWLSDKGII